ncbi:hypothetical protein WEI85_35295 [Actinomycetes bacterium KLBMP 9797]
MIWTKLGNRRAIHRIRIVDAFPFPASGRQRLGSQYPHLSDDDIQLVEAATRQWFRLVIRHSGAKLSMPSVVADRLWQELTRHERDYAALCDAAFGRLLPYRPASTMSAGTVDSHRNPLLLATFGYARQDEGCGPTDLPLLFRVDAKLRVQDGNRYLADCGGRGECFQVPGRVCLQHLAGLGKRLSAPGIRGDLPFHDGRHGYAGGAGDGGEVAGGGEGGGDGGGGGN